MNRTQLTAFAAVAEAQGFTKGAEKLMVSQPAVSLQVAELEAALQAKLFDRLPRGVRLTAAGELLLGYARRIDALEHEAEAAISDLLGLTHGKLVIGASLTIGSYLLPAILGRFRRKYPKIDLVMEIANTHQIEKMLLDHHLDLAFTEGLVPNDTLRAEVFQEDQLVAIAPPKHAILKNNRISAATFAREPIILREVGSGTREVVEDAFARRKLELKPLMSLGSTEAIKRAVQAGVGLAVVSELAIESELSAGTLVVLPLADLRIRRPLISLRLPGKSDSPAARAFMAMVSASNRREHVAKKQISTP